MKKYFLLIIFIISTIYIVDAIEIYDITLNTSNSSTIVRIFNPVNISNITIYSNNITLFNLSRTSEIHNVSSNKIIFNQSNNYLNYTFSDNSIYYIWQNIVEKSFTIGSGMVASSHTIYISIKNQYHNISNVTTELENPNNEKVNYSMTLQTNLSELSSNWTTLFSPQLTGIWSIIFYINDTSYNSYLINTQK